MIIQSRGGKKHFDIIFLSCHELLWQSYNTNKASFVSEVSAQNWQDSCLHTAYASSDMPKVITSPTPRMKGVIVHGDRREPQPFKEYKQSKQE